MHIHTYIHIHICAQPAASVFADVYVGVKTHLCNIHTCPCTSAQNTCKVHVTLNAKKCTYIYTYTHMHTHTCAHENTCACMTPSTRWSTDTKTHHLCTNMHTHTHTHVHKRIDVQIHTHMHIYTYIHVHIHTHIHIYTHTHTKRIYEHTQARLERQRGSERARSCCRSRKLYTSLSFDAIKPHFAPPMQGLHCTHVLQHRYPSSGAAERARRNLSPRMVKVTVHEKRRVNEEQPTPASSPSSKSRQRGSQTTPAHLHWCEASPPSSWSTHVASSGVDARITFPPFSRRVPKTCLVQWLGPRLGLRHEIKKERKDHSDWTAFRCWVPIWKHHTTVAKIMENGDYYFTVLKRNMERSVRGNLVHWVNLQNARRARSSRNHNPCCVISLAVARFCSRLYIDNTSRWLV